MRYKGIIFDLDGVICSTDAYHYLAWKALAGCQAPAALRCRRRRMGSWGNSSAACERNSGASCLWFWQTSSQSSRRSTPSSAASASWLTWDAATLTGTFVQAPERAEIPENIDEQAIVELYSR